MSDDLVTKNDLRTALDGAVQTIITEMGIRFGEVNQRLDRMELAELKSRVEKLEKSG